MHTNKHRITILQVLPALETGGVERGTIDLAIFLKQKGHSPIVASRGGSMVKKLKDNDIQHLSLKLNSKNPITILLNVIKLALLIKQYKVDILHARSRAPAWSALLAAKLTNIPLITTFHGTYNFNNPIKKFYNSVMVKGYRVIATSEFILEHILNNYSSYVNKEQILLINRGVNIEEFNPQTYLENKIAPIRKKWGIAQKKKIILMPGRITHWKGQHTAIEAMQKLSLTHKNFILVILGADQGRTKYSNQLKKYITQNNLQEYVIIKDKMDDIQSAYYNSFAVIHASIEPEAFGRIIIEAQAMHTPVIASNIGAPAKIIQHNQTGLLHHAGDANDLCQQIINLINMSEQNREKITRNGFKNVLKSYNHEKMLQHNIELYTQVLNIWKIS